MYSLILQDYKKNGRCDFTVAKEPDDNLMMLVFPTTKNSPYTEQFSRGYYYLFKSHDSFSARKCIHLSRIMTLESVGLIAWWNKRNYPPPDRCLKWIPPEKVSRLTLRGLSGSFLILGIGYALAFVVFILERANYWRNGWKRNSML